MCILFVANNTRSDYPLIIAANRDEYHARPTALSQFWHTHPDILAGRDLEANGTWMGTTRNGKVAILTNVRQPKESNQNAASRGKLVVNWLASSSHVTPLTFTSSLRETREQYNGYNLVFGQFTQQGNSELHVYNNVNNSLHTIEDGVTGLSNADVITPWPKVIQGVDTLTDYIKSARTIDVEQLFALLRQDNKAPDILLPDTGIGYEWEKALSSIFIQTPKYGTRTSTILLVDNNQTVQWLEREFSPSGRALDTRQFAFKLNTV